MTTLIQKNGAGLDSKKVFCVPDGSGYIYPVQRGECPAIWQEALLKHLICVHVNFPPSLIIGSQLHEWTNIPSQGSIYGSNICMVRQHLYVV
jgi:hypothetical protein